MRIECPSAFPPRPAISHVIFDFDGTLSWLRHGWPNLMAAIFRPYFPAHPGETEEAVRDLLVSEILSRNGNPTIMQMTRFQELVLERGGDCPEPEALRRQYQNRLDALIAERSEQILRHRAPADAFVVHGARAFLEKLRARGLCLIILSASIEDRVRQEAELLGLTGYFGRHIYGSSAKNFSKKLVIDRLLTEEAISGSRLLSFGDGPVEIHETKNAGGLAIAVASDEEDNGSGRPDPWKRRNLLQAGADAVVADFRVADELLKMTLGG
jgi:phosphoglycolate phosphatase-like HAD superfamily hydrolase